MRRPPLLDRSIARLVTSPSVRDLRRGIVASMRSLAGRPPTVLYFHQSDDPYSRLSMQALPLLAERYAVEISAHRVSPPDDAAVPEREMLRAYAERDAALLARGLGWPVSSANEPSMLPPDTAEARARGDAVRKKLGHYLGATFYFEGEWTWGLDRLSSLEARLAPFRQSGAPETLIAPRLEVRCADYPRRDVRPLLEAFVSLRSPYSYLAVPRLTQLAQHYGAELSLRYVLPMVMRGLPVPRAKRLYIVRDAKREAERLGMPFGDIADPVGPGVSRGLAVLHHAISAGLGDAFLLAFLRGVFAEGVDAASDRGLSTIAERAGVPPHLALRALGDASWRAVAEANRQDLFLGGTWGVPAFRVDGGGMHWGQDRLWAVENDLRAAVESRSSAV